MIKISSQDLDISEVWDILVICHRLVSVFIWEVIAEYICEDLNLVEEAVWISISPQVIFVCSSVIKAKALRDNVVTIPKLADIVFNCWTLDVLTIDYASLYKNRWIWLWGLPLNLWTSKIF